jgi:hypothetical protein
MFYLVEHKVAAATGDTPIAVMGEVRQVTLSWPSNPPRISRLHPDLSGTLRHSIKLRISTSGGFSPQSFCPEFGKVHFLKWAVHDIALRRVFFYTLFSERTLQHPNVLIWNKNKFDFLPFF